MRKLLKLCVEAGVALVSTSALDVRNADGDWITTLVINVYGKTASGFWTVRSTRCGCENPVRSAN